MLNFKLNKDGKSYSLIRVDKKAKKITIPKTHKGLPVNKIGAIAFHNCEDLLSVEIPIGIKEIGKNAFACCFNLKEVKIPASVVKIGIGVFALCNSLSSLSVDKDNEVYDSRDKSNAIIETKTGKLVAGSSSSIIPMGVTSIEDYAFFGSCSKPSIELPDSVKSIGKCAFCGCLSLESIILSKNLKEIGKDAFCDCLSLESIEFPDDLLSIGDNAFESCLSLNSIRIPGSVVKIGKSVFAMCNSLSSLSVDKDNEVYDSRDKSNAIIETKTNKLVIGCKNTIIPEGVTSIARGAFTGCIALTKIDIPSSVKNIENEAFAHCGNLTSINFKGAYLPKRIDWVFRFCGKISSITVNGEKRNLAGLLTQPEK